MPGVRCLCLITAVFIVGVFSARLSSAAKSDEEFFTVYELQVQGDFIDYLIDDLNGNGLNDGLFFHSYRRDGKIVRNFSVFYQHADGFNAEADYHFDIDPRAVVYDLADVDSRPGKEILFFKNEGIFYYQMIDGRYDPTPLLLCETPSIFKIPDKLFLERMNFARDLNDDGNIEIIVPQFDQLHIYARQPDGIYGLSAALDCPMLTSVTSLTEVSRYLVSTFLIPNILFVDYNRDQRTDIVTIHDEYLKIFFQNSTGEFSNADSAIVRFNFTLTQAYASKLGNGNIYQRDRFQDKTGMTTLADLNNDGFLDMIVEKFSHKDGLNPKKQFHIYFARQAPDNTQHGGIFNEIPDHIIINRGFQIQSKVADLNNDGKMDICIPVIEIGMFKIIQMLITGNINVDVFWYVMDESGQYLKKPDYELKIKVEIDTQRRKIPVFSMDGDFNGNGRKDLIRSQDGRLMIHYAPDDGVPKEKADVEFEIQMPDNGKMVNPRMIDADNKSDMVMVFTSDDSTAGNGKVMILINN